MVNITAETKRRDITVQGLVFSAPMPYVPGPITLDEGEASQINQVLGENLRNNFAATVDKAWEEAAKATGKKVEDLTEDDLDMDALRAAWEKQATEYKFGVRRATGTRTPTDPVEREALNIARSKVRDAIKAKGNIKLTDVPSETIQKLAEDLIKKYPDITTEAKRRVEAAKAISLDELVIGSPAGDATSAA